MASVNCVSEYHLEDDKAECVSLEILPVQWDEDGESHKGAEEVKIYLHGSAGNGLPEISKRVIAWKFDFSSEQPEIFVLSEENSWIKLGKPRKSFEEIIRSILVTVHCIHYLMRNREMSGDCVWNHLCEVFRLYAVRPSQSDLMDHIPLISDCVNRYRGLEDSKFLATLFEEKTMRRKLSGDDTEARKKSKIIIDDIKDNKTDDAEDEDKDTLFGEICALCDDGGKIICCEGGCLRSFHATEEAGVGSYCKSLGFMPDDIVGMQNFYCRNCEHEQHQCFVCGKLGSSDKSSGSAEVVSCVSPDCGRFYHPHCVAILLHQDTGVPAKELERKIAGRESFTCPIHKCCICKQQENKKDKEFQFAVCMRCPKSYHRKCLPRGIAFEDQGDMLEGQSIVRAWDGLLPNRILIYCLNHDIDVEIGTVRRDHIKFPDVKQNRSTLKKKTILEEKWKPISEFLEEDKVVPNRNISLENSRKGQTRSPYLQKKKTKKLMSGQKPVSKKSNFSPEESDGESSDPVLSELVKQKLSTVNEKKTNIKEKTILEEKKAKLTSMVPVHRAKAVSERKNSSSEGLFRAKNAPTVPKQKQRPSFDKNHAEEKRKLTSELIVDGDKGVSKTGISLGEFLSANASSLPKLKQKSTSAVKLVSNRNNENKSSVKAISRMVKLNNLLKKELQTSVCEKIKTSLGEIPFSSMVSEQKFGNMGTLDASSSSQIRKEMPPGTECGDHGNQPPNPNKTCMDCANASGRIHFNIPDDASRRCTTCKRENSGKPYINGKQNPRFSRGNHLVGQNSVHDHVKAFSSSFYSHTDPIADSLSSINRLAMPSDATILVDPTAPQPAYLGSSMGFALGPHLNYLNSAGWIDE